jgi:hypothetical protein
MEQYEQDNGRRRNGMVTEEEGPSYQALVGERATSRAAKLPALDGP